MNKPRDEREASRAQFLAELLHQEEPGPLWGPEELGAILRHQLAAPLEFNFAENGAATVTAPPTEPAVHSFGELLTQQSPPLVLLEMAKDFAKRYMNQPAGELPREVGAVLYYASILAARIRLGVRISKLDDAELRAGTQWALQQGWLDERLAGVLREGVSLLE